MLFSFSVEMCPAASPIRSSLLAKSYATYIRLVSFGVGPIEFPVSLGKLLQSSLCIILCIICVKCPNNNNCCVDVAECLGLVYFTAFLIATCMYCLLYVSVFTPNALVCISFLMYYYT